MPTWGWSFDFGLFRLVVCEDATADGDDAPPLLKREMGSESEVLGRFVSREAADDFADVLLWITKQLAGEG